MALTFTFRSSVFSTALADTYTTASGAFTPAANSLMVCFVLSNGVVASPSGVSGNGATYSQVVTRDETMAGTQARGELWVATSGASPSSGEVTAATWASNRSGGVVIVVEVPGADLSGGAAAAIVQSPTNDGGGADSTSGSVTLAAAGDAANRPIAFFAHGANEATTFRTDWSELADGSYAGPATGAEVQARSDAFETTASATWATSANWMGIAAEIKAAAGAPAGHAHMKVNAAVLFSKLRGLVRA